MEVMLHRDLLNHLMTLSDNIDIEQLNAATSVVNNITNQCNGDIDEIFHANAQILSNLCGQLYNFAKCPLYKDGGYFHGDDFIAHRDKAINVLKFYQAVSDLFKAVKQRDVKSSVGLLVYGLLLTSEHVDSSNEWSNDDCVRLSQHLQKTLCNVYSCNTLTKVLTIDLQGKHCFHYIMDEIKQSTKQHGAKSVAVLTAFKYLLCSFDASLSDYLHVIFPTCFILIDDHHPRNKANGVTCLQHVLYHSTAAEMSLYGRCDVIYTALYNMLYSNDTRIIQVVLPTILLVIKVESRTPSWMNTFKGDRHKLHDVLHIILRNMEMENGLSLRRIYAEYLVVYIVALGIESVQHYPRLYKVIYNYIEVHDGVKQQSRIYILMTLERLITHTWPRVSKYSSDIMKNLLKLVVDITDGSVVIDTAAMEEVLQWCSRCIKLLYLLEPEPITQTLQGLVVEAQLPQTTREFCTKQLQLHSEES